MADIDKLPAKVREWAKGRTRVGVSQLVDMGRTDKMPEKNRGLPRKVMTDHLHCACTVCGHHYQMECEEASFDGKSRCDCCSGLCT